MLYSSFNRFNNKSTALEADMTKPITTPISKPAEVDQDSDKGKSTLTQEEVVKSREKINEMSDVLSEAISKLVEFFASLFNGIDAKLDLLFASDNDFLKRIEEGKKSKPNFPVTVPTYKCNTKPADIALARFRLLVDNTNRIVSGNAFGSRLPEDSLLEMTHEELIKTILKKLGAPEFCKTMDDFYKYLHKVCKGNQVAIPIYEGDVKSYEDIAAGRKDAIHVKISTDKAKNRDTMAKINANFKLVSTNTNLSKEIRNRAKKYTDRMILIQNMYGRMIDEYVKIKINKINVARGVLLSVYEG